MPAEARWITRLGRSAFVLMVTIVASSAFIRLSAGVPEVSVAAIEAARIAHRVCASLAGLLVLLMAGIVFTGSTGQRADSVLSAAAVAVTLVLAWIGRYSGPEAPAGVLVFNLVGGLALSTLVWAIVARQSAAKPGMPSALALAALAAVTLQCVTGAMTITQFATLGPVHHACGAVALALCLFLGARLRQQPQARPAGYAILALALFQAAAGTAALPLSLPLPLVLAHNIGAALLLAALAHACFIPATREAPAFLPFSS